MIHPLTEHGIALHQRVSELERLCARQQETIRRQAKKRAWLWTAATDAVAIFNIHRSRSQEAAKELLGADFAGAICSDGAHVDLRGHRWDAPDE